MFFGFDNLKSRVALTENGVVTFSDLTVIGYQNTSYTISFSSSAVETPIVMPAITVDECSVSMAHSEANSEGLCVCKPGYAYSFEQGVCFACPLGQYKETAGNVACESCLGSHISTHHGGSVSISNCTCALNFIMNPQDGTCVCNKGNYFDLQTGTGGSCMPCPYGMYIPTLNMDAVCKECMLHSTTLHFGSTTIDSCVCESGYYLPSKDSVECESCPEGGKCESGNNSPEADEGFFAVDDASQSFTRCPLDGACLQGGGCAKGYKGFACGKCADGYYRSGTTCYECKSGSVLFLPLVLVLMLLVVAIIFVSGINTSSSSRWGALRIALSFVQVTSLYAEFRLNWPTEVTDLFKMLTALNFNFEVAAPECTTGVAMSYFTMTAIQYFIPLLALVALIICFIVATIILATKKPPEGHSSWGLLLTRSFYRTIWSIAVIIYLPMTFVVLRFFDCTDYGNGVKLLDAEPSVECYGAEHMDHLYLAIIGICVYVVGIPAAITYSLMKHPDMLYLEDHLAVFGVLYSRYNPDNYLWEVVLEMRGLLLVCSLLLFGANPGLQACLAILILFAAFAAQKRNAFLAEHLNTLENVCLSINIVTLVTGIIFFTTEVKTTRTLFTVIVIVLVVVNIAALGAVILWEARKKNDILKSEEMKTEMTVADSSFEMTIADSDMASSTWSETGKSSQAIEACELDTV